MDARFLADLRFAATPPPQLEGSPKEVEEAWCQWYLEKSFFRDFVYRNPGGRGSGSELADAVVLFDDVALGVQVKAQRSDKDSAVWVKKEGKQALKQLSGTMRMLRDRLVTRLNHEWYGSVEIDPEKYVNHFGLVILGTDVEPFDAYEWFPELGVLPFVGDVLTLHDLELAIAPPLEEPNNNWIRFRGSAQFEATYHSIRGDILRFLEMREQALIEYTTALHQEVSLRLDEPHTARAWPSSLAGECV